jgi:hypothetical protein
MRNAEPVNVLRDRTWKLFRGPVVISDPEEVPLTHRPELVYSFVYF